MAVIDPPLIGHGLIAAGLGAIVGSFLNVVIHRLPARLDYQARVAQGGIDPAGSRAPDGVVFPGSRCPVCQTPIRAWQNIPVVSYLLLCGQARCCGARISPGYPAIELAMAAIAVAVVTLLGPTPYAAAFGVMTALLLAMSVIDAQTLYLPDALTLPGVGLGLAASLLPASPIGPMDAALGAAVGLAVLALARWVFRAVRGVDGLGGGDAKLLALLGAWGGVSVIPLTLVLAPFVALSAVAVRHGVKGFSDPSVVLAFGPYLAAAGWLVLVHSMLVG